MTESYTPTVTESYTPTVTESSTPTITESVSYTPTVTESYTPSITITDTYIPIHLEYVSESDVGIAINVGSEDYSLKYIGVEFESELSLTGELKKVYTSDMTSYYDFESHWLSDLSSKRYVIMSTSNSSYIELKKSELIIIANFQTVSSSVNYTIVIRTSDDIEQELTGTLQIT